jgi:hypothetical protein
MEKIVDLIDKIKTQMPDNDYLEIMNELQVIYDTELLREDDIDDLMRTLREVEGIENFLPYEIIQRIDVPSKDLPLSLLRELNKQAKYIKLLQSAIISQSLEIHENKNLH